MADVQASLPVGEDDSSQLLGTPSKDVIAIRRSTLTYAVLALLLLVSAYLVGWFMGTSSGETAAAMRTAVVEAAATTMAGGGAAAQLQPVLATASAERSDVPIGNNPTIGPENARVTIVEFGDFECPFCKRFHDQVLPALLKQYDGRIRFVYRSFPIRAIHADAESAAEAARCAYDQQKFWEYHDLLFQDTQRLAKADLLAYAGQIKLDTKVFRDCLDSAEHAQDVERDYQTGVTLGVTGTPTFFINGRLLAGAQPLAAFSAVIDAELVATPAPTAAS